MKFALLFEDNPDASPDIRQTHMTDHFAFLANNADQIQAAGPLFNDEGDATGGLWIVEADSASDVKRLVETDPFWPTGLRKTVHIQIWKQVFANGKNLKIG